MSEPKFLKVFSPAVWHDSAIIVGTKESLKFLKDNIDIALSRGINLHDKSSEYLESDGKGFNLIVKLSNESEMSDLPLHYIDREIYNNPNQTEINNLSQIYVEFELQKIE